jgi:hypothetical protein
MMMGMASSQWPIAVVVAVGQRTVGDNAEKRVRGEERRGAVVGIPNLYPMSREDMYGRNHMHR